MNVEAETLSRQRVGTETVASYEVAPVEMREMPEHLQRIYRGVGMDVDRSGPTRTLWQRTSCDEARR